MNPERIIFENCLNLQKDESCLIITDSNKKELADGFFSEAKKITDNTKIVEIPVEGINGQEPPDLCAKDMLEYKVILFITSRSLSHTNARRKATEKGARIASMPGITREILDRAIDVNYIFMKESTERIADLLDDGDELRIVTDAGTNIVFNISNRFAHGRASGIYDDEGAWGNLPSGEAFIAPVEGTSYGAYVVDLSHAGVGKLMQPIKVTVGEGLAIMIEGGEQAEKLKKILDSVGDPNAFNIAEIGIGTNPKALISGNILEDEKVLGTCHIALGKSKGFGGEVDVPVHLDGILKSPTIYVDGRMIMQNGKLIV